MKTYAPATPIFILLLVCAPCAPADITSSASGFKWTEDFEGAALGATSGSNQRIPGTSAQTVNTASSVVVDATTDPAAAAAFPKAEGKFIRLSCVKTNNFSAVRAFNNGQFSFGPVPDTHMVRARADVYFPADIDVPAFSFFPRLESEGASGNGPAFSAGAQSSAGAYSIEYIGTVGEFKNPSSVGDADSFWPFLRIEQRDGASQDVPVTDFMYMDNILVEIAESFPDATFEPVGRGLAFGALNHPAGTDERTITAGYRYSGTTGESITIDSVSITDDGGRGFLAGRGHLSRYQPGARPRRLHFRDC